MTSRFAAARICCATVISSKKRICSETREGSKSAKTTDLSAKKRDLNIKELLQKPHVHFVKVRKGAAMAATLEGKGRQMKGYVGNNANSMRQKISVEKYNKRFKSHILQMLCTDESNYRTLQSKPLLRFVRRVSNDIGGCG
jgi:hypothetical protein